MLFDKTGTLTTGEQGVVAIEGAGDTTEDEVLALAAAVEAKSEHPIARAIVTRAQDAGIKVPRASKIHGAVWSRRDRDGRRPRGHGLERQGGDPSAGSGSTRPRELQPGARSTGRHGGVPDRRRARARADRAWPTPIRPESAARRSLS